MLYVFMSSSSSCRFDMHFRRVFYTSTKATKPKMTAERVHAHAIAVGLYYIYDLHILYDMVYWSIVRDAGT